MNLFESIPNPKRTQDALKNLDFYVAIDTLPQEHVMWADVILPECTYLERYDPLFACADKKPYITMREPAVRRCTRPSPAGGSPASWACALGLQGLLPLGGLRDGGGVAAQGRGQQPGGDAQDRCGHPERQALSLRLGEGRREPVHHDALQEVRVLLQGAGRRQAGPDPRLRAGGPIAGWLPAAGQRPDSGPLVHAHAQQPVAVAADARERGVDPPHRGRQGEVRQW